MQKITKRIKADPVLKSRLEDIARNIENATHTAQLLSIADSLVTALERAKIHHQSVMTISNNAVPAITATSDYLNRLANLKYNTAAAAVDKAAMPMLRSGLSLPLGFIIDSLDKTNS